MKLKQVLKKVPYLNVKGSKDISVFGISNHSKLVFPGCIYIAKKGLKFDGSQFVPEAVSAGASVIVTDLFDPFLKNVTQVIVKNVADCEAILAANYYESPSKELKVIGVVGTNGKTTTSYLIHHLMNAVKNNCSMTGTIENIIGSEKQVSTHSTPDAVTMQKLLKEMVLAKQSSVVMEVTSHGIDQRRVKEVDFDIGIFTNFTQDHLDYHKSMENYFRCKKSFFDDLKKGSVSIINIDDAKGKEIVSDTKSKIVTYGIDHLADYQAESIELHPTYTKFVLKHQNESYPIKVPMVGLFNVYNILAAIVAMHIQNYSFEQIIAGLKSFFHVPGRMQQYETDKGVYVFVDYAHTEDALLKALTTLKAIGKKRIITVFGCGGNRDQLKRAKMGTVAEKYSDFVVLTSDNPRDESPDEIINQILEGIKGRNYLIEMDREKAILKAINYASPQDIVLIAGKGHETYQLIAGKKLFFDDAKILKGMCK
ncbi:MAG TPA: UDP-N-acetylmuramoyl-L-alanyl-D-glutamate--2,6-diaminopimelate ligase [Chlamydiales bacterium]|nr:UDP-N-acetylmuramoyl-L-alanyl-D-glutamate--2,6-diaminopimelate ligase [Chlamydiales bacterium]